MSKMHRAQILIDPEQHETLAEIARQEGASISEIVRQAVDSWLAERRADERLRRELAALAEIELRRADILARRGGQPLALDVAEMLEQSREERDRELLGGLFDDRP
jgi:Arc/MetJ-type ribon-helix-helix transcriptional regulator